MIKILHLEDNEDDAFLFGCLAGKNGHTLEVISNLEDFKKKLSVQGEYSSKIFITDGDVPLRAGESPEIGAWREVANSVRDAYPNGRIIVVSGNLSKPEAYSSISNVVDVFHKENIIGLQKREQDISHIFSLIRHYSSQ